MAKRFEKKLIVFIVEGSSDKKALEGIFKKIYKHNKQIVFKFTNGDVTSDDNINQLNVCNKIYEKVNEIIKDKKLSKKHIWQIVHIFDTDGTYIPDTAISMSNSSKFIYSATSISCNNINDVINRNKKKSNIMDYLLSIQNIKGIPYTGYFMSSNLEHALYGIQNLDDDLKGIYADNFYEAFLGKEELFIDYLREEVANGVPNSFPASWRYIKEGLHSLERHSNLHIYFDQNPY